MTALPLLPTTVVGSYPQPDWLIDRERLAHAVPRVKSIGLDEVRARGEELFAEENLAVAVTQTGPRVLGVPVNTVATPSA